MASEGTGGGTGTGATGAGAGGAAGPAGASSGAGATGSGATSGVGKSGSAATGSGSKLATAGLAGGGVASVGGGSGTYRNAQPIVSRHKAADSSGTWLLVIFLALLVIPVVAVTAVPRLRNRSRPSPA